MVAVLVSSGCGGTKSNDAAVAGKPEYGSEEFGLDMEQLALRIEQTEGAIGECMAQAGFQYVPLDFVSVKKAMDSDQSAPGLSSEQYVEQFGLGVTTQFDKPILTFGAGPQNQELLAALPSRDQTAYRRALWGEQPDWTFVSAMEQEDMSQTDGCTRGAVEQFFSTTERNGSYVNPGDKLVESDKRMIDALTTWSDCMRDAGYDYDHPDAIADDLVERLQAITQGQDPAALSATAQEALTELQGEELAIARADLTCFEDNVEEVEAEIEAEIYGASQN